MLLGGSFERAHSEIVFTFCDCVRERSLSIPIKKDCSLMWIQSASQNARVECLFREHFGSLHHTGEWPTDKAKQPASTLTLPEQLVDCAIHRKSLSRRTSVKRVSEGCGQLRFGCSYAVTFTGLASLSGYFPTLGVKLEHSCVKWIGLRCSHPLA